MLITDRNYRPQTSLIFLLPAKGASTESHQIFNAFNNDSWRAIARYEDKSNKIILHTYIEPLSENDYECLPPQETYKIKIRIAKITHGKPSI